MLELMISISIPSDRLSRIRISLQCRKKVMKERKIDGTGKHVLFGYLLLLVENGINVMLIGPAGTGKSHIAEQVADFMNVKYGEIGLGSGASRGDLLGRHTISQEKPWITSEYTSIYSGGGIINREEIDRADPGVLITLNNSIAGNALYNSIDGERYQKSDAVCVMSTANTFGLQAQTGITLPLSVWMPQLSTVFVWAVCIFRSMKMWKRISSTAASKPL